MPAINVDIPSINLTLPALKFDMPSFDFSMPAINLDIPPIHIDLSGISEAVENSVRSSLNAINDIEVHSGPNPREVSRVKSMMRDWRAAMRNAQDTGDWQDADDIAQELSRAADRLGSPSPDVRVIHRQDHRYPRS